MKFLVLVAVQIFIIHFFLFCQHILGLLFPLLYLKDPMLGRGLQEADDPAGREPEKAVLSAVAEAACGTPHH